MDIYTLARIKSRYPVDLDSGYSPGYDKYTDSLFQWPGNNYFNPWDREKQILADALRPVEVSAESLTEQVFGRDGHAQKLHLQHGANLLAHRYALHKRHLNDLNHRIGQLQEQISIAKLWAPGPADKQQIDLEKLLARVESQRHDEETGLWKDTVKLRQEILAGAREYQATRHRAQILADMEERHGTSY